MKTDPEPRKPILAPDIDVLEVVPSPFKRDPRDVGVAGQINVDAPEFTHLDTKSTIPHLARVTIMYVPREATMNPESFGNYLATFRNFRGSPEESIELLCKQLVEKLEPFQIRIQTQWSPRAGVSHNPTAQWVHPELQKQQAGPRIVTPETVVN